MPLPQPLTTTSASLLLQAAQASQASQAPQAPLAPSAPVPAPPSADELSAQIRDQVRKSIEDAKKAARDARVAAQQAKHPELPTTPVVVSETGTLLHPFDQESAQRTARDVAQSFFVFLAVVLIGVPLVRAFARRLGPAPTPPAIPVHVSEQLQRIEHAVEAVAIEVERISESQRFLTKLQAGKGEPAALPPRSGA